MNEILICAGVAVTCVALNQILKGTGSGFAAFCAIGGVILLSLMGIYRLIPALDFFRQTAAGSGIEEYLQIALRAGAIAFITDISADVCRDAGEASLAARLEFCGKAGIILTILPVMRVFYNLIIQ